MAKPNLKLDKNSTYPEVLKYIGHNKVILDLPFILTHKKRLTKGSPYLFIEGNRSLAVRLLDVCDESEFVYLKIQDIRTNRCFTVSWNLNYKGEYWLWSLSTVDHLENLTEKAGKFSVTGN